MEDIITLDYGSGGKKTSALIEGMIVPLLKNDALCELGDGAVLSGAERLVFSTDSFVVNPYFFPGGDIGKLCVCGTVNDLLMCGGEPKYLSLSLVIEEGLPFSHLRRIIESVRDTAAASGVSVVTGDTKVVERGRGDGIYINTAGIGFLKLSGLSRVRLRAGDRILLSGSAGDHGAAVMLARNKELMQADIISDCAPLNAPASELMSLGGDLRVMRDPTRGGVATTLCEFVEDTPLGIELVGSAIPVRAAVRSACELLGLDPLYCACEGRLLAAVAADRADEALSLLRALPQGENAAIIGEVTERLPGRVTVKTPLGGSRIVSKLAGAQLPRIC